MLKVLQIEEATPLLGRNLLQMRMSKFPQSTFLSTYSYVFYVIRVLIQGFHTNVHRISIEVLPCQELPAMAEPNYRSVLNSDETGTEFAEWPKK